MNIRRNRVIMMGIFLLFSSNIRSSEIKGVIAEVAKYFFYKKTVETVAPKSVSKFGIVVTFTSAIVKDIAKFVEEHPTGTVLLVGGFITGALTMYYGKKIKRYFFGETEKIKIEQKPGMRSKKKDSFPDDLENEDSESSSSLEEQNSNNEDDLEKNSTKKIKELTFSIDSDQKELPKLQNKVDELEEIGETRKKNLKRFKNSGNNQITLLKQEVQGLQIEQKNKT